MAFVRTVLGDIPPEELGYTMAHEHVFTQKGRQLGPETEKSLWRWDEQLQAVRDYAAVGGKCLIDCTPRYWDGRDPAGMYTISKETGVNVVACTGCVSIGDWNNLTEEFKDLSVDDLADRFAKEVETGMDGTSIKAGFIKVDTNYMYMTPGQEKAFRAAAKASLRTGAPVHTHTANGTYAFEQTELLAAEGLPMDRLVIAHIDRNLDYWYHKKLLEKGVYLIYDGPGKAKYYPDSMRIEVLKKLVADGFGDKIMFSNDMGKKTHFTVYGFGPGWTWIKTRFLPRLLDEGFTQEQIDNFMIHNPARFYSMRE